MRQLIWNGVKMERDFCTTQLPIVESAIVLYMKPSRHSASENEGRNGHVYKCFTHANHPGLVNEFDLVALSLHLRKS